jgi:hypothetical protein
MFLAELALHPSGSTLAQRGAISFDSLQSPQRLRRIRSYGITRSDKRRIAAEIREKPLAITADFDGF